MNVKTISRMLLAFSAVMIYMAMTMDTTVSTGYGYVHNIGLQSEQTNMLILGGIGFIAGIVLFSTSKIKQTKQEEEDEKAAIEAKIHQVNTTAKSVVSTSGSIFQSWWKGLDSFLKKFTIPQIWWKRFDKIFSRIVFFVLMVIFNSYCFVVALSKLFGNDTNQNNLLLLTLCVSGFYLLMPRPAVKIITNLLTVYTVFWSFIGIVNLGKYFINGDIYSMRLTFFAILMIFVSIGIIWLMRNARRKIAN